MKCKMTFLFILSVLLSPPVIAQEADPAQEAPPATSEAQEASDKNTPRDLGILEGIIEDFEYNGANKRDPFAPYRVYQAPDVTNAVAALPPSSELETFDLDQLKIVGIIWNVAEPRAFVLAPNNKTFVLKKDVRIGRNQGKVVSIREGEVVIVESFMNQGRFSYQPRIMKLQRE